MGLLALMISAFREFSKRRGFQRCCGESERRGYDETVIAPKITLRQAVHCDRLFDLGNRLRAIMLGVIEKGFGFIMLAD